MANKSAPVPVVSSDDDFDSIESMDVDEKVTWVKKPNPKVDKTKAKKIQ